MIPIQPIRTERRFGVTAKLTPNDRLDLLGLRTHAGWPVLLDVLEMACIEQETILINTEADTPDSVLANHRMAKAMWQMFEQLQERVEIEFRSHLEGIASKPVPSDLTDEEKFRENTLNPTVYFPEQDEMEN